MGDIDLETGCLARAKVGYLGAAKKPVRRWVCKIHW